MSPRQGEGEEVQRGGSERRFREDGRATGRDGKGEPGLREGFRDQRSMGVDGERVDTGTGGLGLGLGRGTELPLSSLSGCRPDSTGTGVSVILHGQLPPPACTLLWTLRALLFFLGSQWTSCHSSSTSPLALSCLFATTAASFITPILMISIPQLWVPSYLAGCAFPSMHGPALTYSRPPIEQCFPAPARALPTQSFRFEIEGTRLTHGEYTTMIPACVFGAIDSYGSCCRRKWLMRGS
ncbi:uncharacterized protein BDV17DRAFT_237837 [Aspergillus undulatus]|uniref:uncharacterized protein n=1 Tax=Aspergillus undulatus TaxID=1810928 RepID=UPI003CCCCE49